MREGGKVMRVDLQRACVGREGRRGLVERLEWIICGLVLGEVVGVDLH
jgi:hypothetical protein